MSITFGIRVDDSSPFINVTCKGPRAKKPTHPHAAGLSFQEALQKTGQCASCEEIKAKPPRGGSLRQYLLDKAAFDPVEAADLARGYAYHSLNGQVVDLSDYPVIRYCATGEVVTDESSTWFENSMQVMQRQRSELYESELMKGTPAKQILEKILDFNDGLPQRFRDIANW